MRPFLIRTALLASVVGACALVAPPITVERAVQEVAGVPEQGAAVDGGVILVRVRPDGPKTAEVVFASGNAAGQTQLDVIAAMPIGEGSSFALAVCGTATLGGARFFIVGSASNLPGDVRSETDGLVIITTLRPQEETSESAFVMLPPPGWLDSLSDPDVMNGDHDLVAISGGLEILRIRAANVDGDAVRAGLAAAGGCVIDGAPIDGGAVPPATCTAPVDPGPEADGPSPYSLFVILRCGAAVAESRSGNAGLACTYDISDRTLQAAFVAADDRAISRLDITAQHTDVVEKLGSHVDRQLAWVQMSLAVGGTEYIISTLEPGASIGTASGLFGDGGWTNLVVDAIQPDGMAIELSFICDRVVRQP